MASEFKVVRMIFGKNSDYSMAKDKYEFLPSGGINDVIALWHAKQTDRPLSYASPSKLTTCPRVVWLANHGVESTEKMTWAVKQRMLLGRVLENKLAEQIAEVGGDTKLLYHWKDDDYTIQSLDEDDRPFKFSTGEGDKHDEGVPDYLISVKTDEGEVIAISDAKTSRSDSFGYVEFDNNHIFDDGGWFKYKIQLTDYYMLCHSPEGKAWFKENNLPLPTHCHLFSYALDDGVVRREVLWQPTQEDMNLVLNLRVRFNQAVHASSMPDCTCATDLPDNFAVKFCRYGVKQDGEKVCGSCCGDNLIERIEK